MLAVGSSQPGTDDHKTRESKIQLSHLFEPFPFNEACQGQTGFRDVIICQFCIFCPIVQSYCKGCVLIYLILNLRKVYVSFEYIQE